MKIMLLGSHGTGKSSIAEYFKVSTGFEILDDIVRSSVINPKGRKLSIEEQMYINAKYYSKLFEWCKSKDNFFSVDSIFRAKAYAYHSRKLKVMFEEIIRFEVRYIDYYFFLPTRFILKEDDFHNADVGFQKKIDERLLNLLIQNVPSEKLIVGITPNMNNETIVEFICRRIGVKDGT